MERILLTGAGMVGAQIAKLLSERCDNLPVVMDLKFQWDYLDTILRRDQYIPVEGSILNRPLVERIIREFRIRRIIHTAAVLPMRVGHDPHPSFYEVNTWGTANLLFAARDCGVRRFVMFSTNGVYLFREHGVDGPVTEDFPTGLSLHNSYGSSKAAAEALLLELTNANQLEGRIVRPGEIFGPVMNRASDTPIYWKAMIDAAIVGSAYVLEGHPEHRLDWVYVKDVAQVATLVATRDTPHLAYHASYGACTGIYDLKEALDRLFPGNNVVLSNCERGGWNYPLSMERVYDDFGFKPEFDLELGVRDYSEWYSDILVA